MRSTNQLAQIFGSKVADTVASARVLVVGAGGIGCELLKNLSMSGFQHINAIDLDTIDLSNLNRQFLFQRKHIKRPKAQVAVQAITNFNPGLDAVAQQANIKESVYDVDWFSGFDLVLNALDNLDARRHVNKMCLAANVPLVESGTAGYLGQVTVISGGETECFECQPKAAERKTYPVCTIRSTPSAPIHCIVWAKDYLFAQLFGEQVSSQDEGMDAQEKAENMEELRQLREESQALAQLAEAMDTSDFARLVFEKVFYEDTGRLLSMKDMWTNRRPPTQLSFKELSQKTKFDPHYPDDHAVLAVEDWCALFVYSAEQLARRLTQASQGEPRFLVFDKDDSDALNFVAATANLRSFAFGIEQKSIFAIKAMAGNIIPAIATTNAIVAGMMVTQAIMALSGRLSDCHTAYVSYSSKRSRCIVREPLAKPNPQCPVCRRRYLTLRVRDSKQVTLGDVLDYIGKLAASGQDLNLNDLSVVEGSRMLYDPDFEDNLSKTLESLGLVPGRMITLTSEDDDDGTNVPVVLSIAKARSQADPLQIEGLDKIPEFAPPVKPENTAEAAADDQYQMDTAGVIVLDDGEGGDGSNSAIVLDDDVCAVEHISDELNKRKLAETTASDEASKRRAV
ncbi:E1 ubiquitin-activating protein uba2 [Coemansia sp. RSA 2336]|nr:E1 ubiquitin-activating protein uba2 [Coemansia sp. RSA 2336]